MRSVFLLVLLQILLLSSASFIVHKEGHKCYTGPGSNVLGYDYGMSLDYCATRCFETDLVSQGCSHMSYNPKGTNSGLPICSYTIGCTLQANQFSTVYVQGSDEVSTTTATPVSVPNKDTCKSVHSLLVMSVITLFLFLYL